MLKLDLDMIVSNPNGIHARPSVHIAGIFRTLKKEYDVEAYFIEGKYRCSAIIEILTMGKFTGDSIHLSFEGNQAQEAQAHFIKETTQYFSCDRKIS